MRAANQSAKSDLFLYNTSQLAKRKANLMLQQYLLSKVGPIGERKAKRRKKKVKEEKDESERNS